MSVDQARCALVDEAPGPISPPSAQVNDPAVLGSAGGVDVPENYVVGTILQVGACPRLLSGAEGFGVGGMVVGCTGHPVQQSPSQRGAQHAHP